ncbi:hypothetical protein ISCGN_025452 [Ixodes scapularis]
MLKKAALDALPPPTDTSHETAFADYESVPQAIAEDIDESNTRFESKYISPWSSQPRRQGTHGTTGGPHQQPPQSRQHQFLPQAPKPIVVSSIGGNDGRYLWLFRDDQGLVHGPYPEDKMASWFESGDLKMSLSVRRTCDQEFQMLGQVIKNWGRFPFKSQGQATSSGDVVDNWLVQKPFKNQRKQPRLPPGRPITASQVPGRRPVLPCSPECEAPFKAVLKPLPPPKERSHGGRHDQREASKPQSAFQRISAQKSTYLFLGDGPQEYPKMCQAAATVEPRSPREGAWGGYENTSSQRRPIPQPTVVSTRLPPSPQPSTWAGVCQKLPVEPVESWEQPIVIENMTSFPSLEGKADCVQQQKSLWERRSAADQEFTRWSYESLKALPSYVHVPTLFELLRDVDSSEEIQEYVKMHLGEDDDVKRFSQEFIRRRFRWKELTGWKSPAAFFDPGKAGSSNDASVKSKKKMQKLDGSMLGFVMAGDARKTCR